MRPVPPPAPRHRGSFPGQPRQHVIQLRQLDLQLALAASCMARENIENQLRSVDHPAFSRLFYVALLHRREVAVEDDERRFVRRGFGADFIQLAAPHQRCGVSGVSHLENSSSDFRSRAARQFNQLEK